MTSSSRRLLLSLVGAALGIAQLAGAPHGALAADATSSSRSSDGIVRTHVGSYLAGRFARGQHDTAAAAQFFSSALQRDRGNESLIEQSFFMEAVEGNEAAAGPLAAQLVKLQPGHRLARMWLGVDAVLRGDLDLADEHFRNASVSPIGELTSALARGWVALAASNDVDQALNRMVFTEQAEWAQFYLRYHRALIADIGGRSAIARRNYERIFRLDSRTPRTAIAYARHASNSGDVKLARSIVRENIEKASGEGHPMARELADVLAASEAKLDLLVTKPREGLAEVFYGLGEALTGEGGYSIGAIYLQLALRLDPQFPFALAALANVYESTKRYEQAIRVYDRIPADTPLATSIEIRKAINLNLLDRVEDARDILDDIIKRQPQDLRPLDAMGSILRGRKLHKEAIDYYDRAILLIDKPQKRHWPYWYARGTSYERLKNWTKAEADLKKALQLNPEQPNILNYLGYTWIDQNRNLKQGMALIEKAVAMKPDDGYIVDSLGWAHYRLGNFKEAVRYLERAVELRPEDPVLNDHLGDALWRINRRLEARFQWSQALTLNPEPDEAEKIKVKLEKGLPSQAALRVPRRTKAFERAGLARQRTTPTGDQPSSGLPW